MRFKFDIGDLVTFQKTKPRAWEWQKATENHYVTAIVVGQKHLPQRLKPNFPSNRIERYVLKGIDGKMYIKKGEDLTLVAKVNP